jgi:hypothetical protein
MGRAWPFGLLSSFWSGRFINVGRASIAISDYLSVETSNGAREPSISIRDSPPFGLAVPRFREGRSPNIMPLFNTTFSDVHCGDGRAHCRGHDNGVDGFRPLICFECGAKLCNHRLACREMRFFYIEHSEKGLLLEGCNIRSPSKLGAGSIGNNIDQTVDGVQAAE